MTPALLNDLRAALEARRDALISEGDFQLEPTATGESSQDEDARPLGEMNQIIASERNKARADELREINVALRRIAAAPDDFGYCETCDEPIAPSRLKLIPWARFCVECQDTHDPTASAGRKHLLDFR